MAGHASNIAPAHDFDNADDIELNARLRVLGEDSLRRAFAQLEKENKRLKIDKYYLTKENGEGIIDRRARKDAEKKNKQLTAQNRALRRENESLIAWGKAQMRAEEKDLLAAADANDGPGEPPRYPYVGKQRPVRGLDCDIRTTLDVAQNGPENCIKKGQLDDDLKAELGSINENKKRTLEPIEE